MSRLMLRMSIRPMVMAGITVNPTTTTRESDEFRYCSDGSSKNFPRGVSTPTPCVSGATSGGLFDTSGAWPTGADGVAWPT